MFRLRQDVVEAGKDPALFDNLKDVRSLEYEVDYLTNKCKVGGRTRRSSSETTPCASGGGDEEGLWRMRQRLLSGQGVGRLHGSGVRANCSALHCI